IQGIEMPTKKKKLCFVLMPFKDEMKEVYWKAIKPAAEDVEFDCLRVDERKGPLNIPKEIVQHIFSSDAIVADLTGKNPNVFYEMGIAHAIANKTVMIIQKTEDLPFDVNNYRCIHYEQTENGLAELKTKLSEFLRCLDEWNNIPTNPVQDFKPHDAFILQSVQKELENQLQEKEKLLFNSVPLTQIKALQKELDRNRKELDKRPEQAEFLNLKKENEQLQFRLLEKDYIEKNLRSELHQIKVTLDEADKKKPAETKIIPPPGMVLIPDGSYTIGELKKQVTVLPFYLAKFVVTNRLYSQFVQATKHQKPTLWDDKKFNGDDQPVVGVSWDDAAAYCDWLTKTKKDKMNFRLPSEAEWEWAASRGERIYPWGNEKPDYKLANYDEKVGQTTPVGSYPTGATPDGLMDMAGNVWEWCADWYDEKKDSRVLRGGSWLSNEYYVSCSYRNGNFPGLRANVVGFRVCCGA
ncbi:MAG: SUMF1/EgtB/PvdO family nonheme iron enzyme, partial [bacterium]|nr:SUMF1/EgtB/PvdO family nonheme iron enzyme [bacterium]